MSLIREIIQKEVIDVVRKKRSSKWRTVRKKFMKGKTCAVCGATKSLECHHIKDFSTNPELELEPTNLLALCDGSMRCHRIWGHLGNWKSINDTIVKDAAWFLSKIISRR